MSQPNKRDRADQARLRIRRKGLGTWNGRGSALPVLRFCRHTSYDLLAFNMPDTHRRYDDVSPRLHVSTHQMARSA